MFKVIKVSFSREVWLHSQRGMPKMWGGSTGVITDLMKSLRGRIQDSNSIYSAGNCCNIDRRSVRTQQSCKQETGVSCSWQLTDDSRQGVLSETRGPTLRNVTSRGTVYLMTSGVPRTAVCRHMCWGDKPDTHTGQVDQPWTVTKTKDRLAWHSGAKETRRWLV